LPALAESKVRIVRVSYVEGDVELDRGDSRGFVRAFQNMPVIEGVRLWTRSDARVEVEFEDGSTVRMVPDSLVNFEELRTGNSGEKITRVDVQQGTLYANLKDHDHDQLSFTFAQQELTLKHSSRFRLDIDKEQLKVAVFRGEVELQRHNAERVKIKKNETLAIDFSEPERYYLSKGIVEEAQDYWDRDREEQRVVAEQRARTNTYPVSTVYYGYDDLAPYGSWSLVPTYGYVWRPYSVAIGWDPFAYGAWVWYPRFGYVWTSAYPWGWTPYRYGSWVFINNRGWCWRSGPRINITNINIINPPPRYIQPRPPVVNNVPIVTVNAGTPRPADPRGDWMPRVGPRDGGVRVVTENEPRPGALGRRGLTNNDVPSSPDNTARNTSAGAVANPRSGDMPRDVMMRPDTNAKSAINQSPRIRTSDKDYNAVDYRSAPVNRDARPATSPGNDVVEASRNQRGRPDPDRDDISRPAVNRTPAADAGETTPDSDGPQRNSAPAIDRNDSRPQPSIERQVPDRSDRPAPAPRVEQPRVERATPPPQMDRPAPAPRAERPAPATPRESPRASMPERSSSPPPAASVPRSSPPSSPPPSAPAMSAPRSMPSPSPSPAPARSSGGRSRDQ
jgi:hypothetical protein